MAINSSIYLATQDIAERTGAIVSSYRTKDGRFIINHSDLMRVQFSTEELLNGISDKVEQIDEETATTLIRENGYKLGRALPEEEGSKVQEVQGVQEEEEGEAESREDGETELREDGETESREEEGSKVQEVQGVQEVQEEEDGEAESREDGETESREDGETEKE